MPGGRVKHSSISVKGSTHFCVIESWRMKSPVGYIPPRCAKGGGRASCSGTQRIRCSNVEIAARDGGMFDLARAFRVSARLRESEVSNG